MRLRDILCNKGVEVHTIGPDATLDEAIAELVRFNVGSLIICESVARGTDVSMIGIVTERDILRVLAARRPIESTKVAEVMSPKLITARPEDPVEIGMALMTGNRVRHLPIVDEQRQLHGVISIGDIVKSQDDQLQMENHYMSSYILGEGGEIGTVNP